MDQSPVCVTTSAPKKKKKKPMGNLGRHAGRRKQKTQRDGAIVASFPSRCEPSPSTSVPVQESGVTQSAFPSDLPREKHLRNRAVYAKRKSVKKKSK